MKFEFVIDGLRLPRLNEILRWHWRQRHEEGKKVKSIVRNAARQAGYLNPTPLRKAQVCVTAYGPYERRDSDATIPKFVVDALVARKIRVAGRNVGREYGFIEDDSRAVIGNLEFKEVMAKDFKVEVSVHEV